MSFRTSKPDYVPVPEGVYLASLVMLVDLGHDPKYGKEQVAMQFELHALPGAPSLDDGGKTRPPRLWMMPMTLSMFSKAKLAGLVAGWDGVDVDDVDEDQDLEERLGKWARAQIVHDERKGRVYAGIAALSPLHKGEAAHLPQPYFKAGLYDVREGRCDRYENLPGWLQIRAMASPEWQANSRKGSTAPGNGVAPDSKPAARPRRRAAGRAVPAAVREAADRFKGDDSVNSETEDEDVPY